MSEIILRTENVTQRFGGLVAVNDVSFELHKGEIVGIIGPNGAGKTTIFNMLTGVYHVNGGKILFDGKEIQNKQPRDIVKAGIARTFRSASTSTSAITSWIFSSKPRNTVRRRRPPTSAPSTCW